jgi:hypothetical protein
MAEADINLRPFHTSIFDIYKGFEPLVCCLKGTWVHPFTVTPAKLAPDFGIWVHLPDLDKTWDAQNYVSKELKSGRSPNQPCNSVGLGDGVILRITKQFPSRFSFV